MTVKIGDRAIYFPRVPYGRQSELFCFVTRVIDAENGVIDLIAFPANSEMMHVSNVAPMGGLVQIHCWEPSAEDKRIGELEERLAALEIGAGTDGLQSRKSEEKLADEAFLEGSQWTPEQQEVIKRKPGRPPKVKAA